jgi:hypothetical protein
VLVKLFTGHVGFEVLTAVTMKNAVLRDMVPCRSCENRSFGRKFCLHLQGRKIRKRKTALTFT